VDGASKSDTKEDVSTVKDEDGKAENTPAAEDKDKTEESSSSPPPTERFRPKRPKRQPAKFKDTDIDAQQSKDDATNQPSDTTSNTNNAKVKEEVEGESTTPPIIEPQEYCKKFCQPLKKQQNKAMNAILKQGIELGESMESDDANTAANSAGNQVGQGGGGGTTDSSGGVGRNDFGGMFPQDKELMLQQMQQELHQLQQRNNQVSGKMRHEMVSTGVPLRDSMSGLASMMQYAAQRDHRQSRRGSNNSMFDNMSLSSFPMDSTNMANSPNPFKEVINKDNFFNAMSSSGMTPGATMNPDLMGGGGDGNRGNSMLNNMSDMELKQRMMRVMSESANSMGMMMNTPGNDYGNVNAESQLGKRKYSYDRSGGGNDAPSSPSGPKKSFLQRERIMDAEMRNHMLSALQGSAGAPSMMTTPGNMEYNQSHHDGMLMQQANAIQHARMMAQFNQRNVGLPSLNSPTEDADGGGSSKKKSKKTPKKSNTSSSSKKKKNTDGKKLTAKEVAASILQATGIEKPKRPFSAYNLFFQLEREFIKHEIADGRKPTDDPMIRDALDAVANGVPKPEDSGGVKPGLLCIDKEVFKSILMKNQMSGEFSCYGNCIACVNLGALLLTLSSHLYPPSSNYTDSKLYADPNLPSRYTHMKLDKYWYSISHKQKRKHRKTEGGSVGFIELTKMVSARWKQIDKTDPDVKEYCQKLADIELDKYKIDMDEYKQKVQGAELNATSNEMMQLHGQDQYSSMPPLSSTKKKSATKSKKKQSSKNKNSSSPPPDNVQSNFGGGMDMMNMMSMMSNGGDMARFTDLAKMSGSSFLNNTPGNNSILPGITGAGGLPPPPFGGDGREQQAAPSVSTAGDRARMAAQMNVGRMNQGLMNDKMLQLTSNFGRGGTGSSDVASSDMLRKMAKLAEEEARFRMMQEEMQGRRGGDSNRFNDQQQGGQQGGNFSGRGGTSGAEDKQFDQEVERFLGSLKQEIKQNRRQQQQMGGGGGDMPNSGGNFNAEEMARMMAGRSSGGIGGGSSSAFQNRGGSGSESRADMMARMMQMVNNDSGGGGGADNLMMEMMARRLAAGDSANNNRSMPRPPFNEDNFQGQQSDGGQGEQGSIEKV